MTRRVVLVGCGNITSTRHIPALKKTRDITVSGVVGTVAEGVDACARAVQPIAGGLEVPRFVGDVRTAEVPAWVSDADLIIVGTPPMTHAGIATRLAEIAPKTSILMEKPLVVTPADREAMAALEARRPYVSVMHNFQFARGFQRALGWIRSGKIGQVRSVQAYQWSTRARRLPAWYRELPYGLFWDEAAHFMYLTEAVVGEMTLVSAAAFPGRDRDDPTPAVLTAMLQSGDGVPVEIAMHFDAGISEWGVIVSGDAGTVVYDLFRDIAMRLPYDGIHLGKEVLRTSVVSTFQHWAGIALNGTRRVNGSLHYGIDQVIRLSLAGRTSGQLDPRVSIAAGLRITDRMRDIATNAGERS